MCELDEAACAAVILLPATVSGSRQRGRLGVDEQKVHGGVVAACRDDPSILAPGCAVDASPMVLETLHHHRGTRRLVVGTGQEPKRNMMAGGGGVVEFTFKTMAPWLSRFSAAILYNFLPNISPTH